jgi:hypothetical protein
MALGGFLVTACSRGAEPDPTALPVSCVAYLGSESPRAMLTGILRSEIDFDALDRDMARVAALFPQWANLSGADLLMDRFDSVSMLNFCVWPLRARLWLVSAAHDRIVVSAETRRVEHNAGVAGATVVSETVPGGHVSAIALTRFLLVPTIIRAIHSPALLTPAP